MPTTLAEGRQTLAPEAGPANTGNLNPDDHVITTLPNGHIAVGSKGANGESLIVLDGSNTIIVPTALSTPLTLTTLGETFTFSPLPSAVGDHTYEPRTTTLPNGQIAVASKGPNGESILVLSSSNTITLPAATSTPVALTRMGETLVSPPQPLSDLGQYGTTTLPDGHVAVGSKGPNGESLIILDGSSTVTVPTSLSTPVTLTTLGETFTFSPPSTTSPEGGTDATAATMASYTPLVTTSSKPRGAKCRRVLSISRSLMLRQNLRALQSRELQPRALEPRALQPQLLLSL
ncbi:hypothetical protein PG997_011487 [Apiospora hydei]|uniref:Uncharacterized protein n=1 Tax=Apiospora hydei TaxID=1337664 RepID=A0ABR1VMZ2_9PEZI